MMSNHILEVAGLCKSYDDFTLDHVSFALPKGSIMGLIGTNGAGKSTTIKLILDLVKREQGTITLFGKENTDISLKQDIGVVFDENNFPDVLAPEKISRIMENIYQNWDGRQFSNYLKRFELPARKSVNEFSRGMKMKLNLAVALSHGAKLLILDEPTGGLDPIVRNEILDLFLEFIEDEEHAILLSSHITTDLEKIADYITFINHGKIILSESKDDLIYNYGVMKGGKEAMNRITKLDCLGIKESAYGFEALVSDKNKMAQKYPDLIIDSASLEDIMMFIVKNKRK